jgi:hypothetical protein
VSAAFVRPGLHAGKDGGDIRITIRQIGEGEDED